MQVAMKILENLSHNQVCFPVVMIHAPRACAPGERPSCLAEGAIV